MEGSARGNPPTLVVKIRHKIRYSGRSVKQTNFLIWLRKGANPHEPMRAEYLCGQSQPGLLFLSFTLPCYRSLRVWRTNNSVCATLTVSLCLWLAARRTRSDTHYDTPFITQTRSGAERGACFLSSRHTNVWFLSANDLWFSPAIVCHEWVTSLSRPKSLLRSFFLQSAAMIFNHDYLESRCVWVTSFSRAEPHMKRFNILDITDTSMYWT